MLGVSARTVSNVKEELAGLRFAESPEDDLFREKLGSRSKKSVAGVGIQAEVASIGLSLEVKAKVKKMDGQNWGKIFLPKISHYFILLAVVEICSSQPTPRRSLH